MHEKVYRYKFKPKIKSDEIEKNLILAVLAVECLYGESNVRLKVTYFIDKAKQICVISAGSSVGMAINQIFTGFSTKEFGENSFIIR